MLPKLLKKRKAARQVTVSMARSSAREACAIAPAGWIIVVIVELKVSIPVFNTASGWGTESMLHWRLSRRNCIGFAAANRQRVADFPSSQIR
jgi:hypothetical protein